MREILTSGSAGGLVEQSPILPGPPISGLIDREQIRIVGTRLPIPQQIVPVVVNMATENPWYGYQRIAVMCRRQHDPVKDRQAYRVMKDHDLLQKRRPYKAEVYRGGRAIRIPRWQGWARGAKEKLDKMLAAQAA